MLLDVVQNALRPPRAPGSGAPEPPLVQLDTGAPGSVCGAVPARLLPPERPPMPPSYEELFPEYAPPDRAPLYHVLFLDWCPHRQMVYAANQQIRCPPPPLEALVHRKGGLHKAPQSRAPQTGSALHLCMVRRGQGCAVRYHDKVWSGKAQVFKTTSSTTNTT